MGGFAKPTITSWQHHSTDGGGLKFSMVFNLSAYANESFQTGRSLCCSTLMFLERVVLDGAVTILFPPHSVGVNEAFQTERLPCFFILLSCKKRVGSCHCHSLKRVVGCACIRSLRLNMSFPTVRSLHQQRVVQLSACDKSIMLRY